MGIPHLTRTLLPHSAPILLSPDPNPRPSPSSPSDPPPKTIPTLLIDGPGLIYHIHHRLLALKPGHLNALDAQPTCREISEGVVAFLGAVRGRGVVIKKIYFDGSLPLSKRETRKERMETSRRKMEGICRTYAGGFKASTTSTYNTHTAHPRPSSGGVEISTTQKIRSNPAPLFGAEGGSSVLQKFRGVPENPFMTPAVIEDLMSYWTWGLVREIVPRTDVLPAHLCGDEEELAFADIVEMVPNEADIYCAFAAQQWEEGPIGVLTSDSDLLVHDLGVYGSVVFYDSLSYDLDLPTQKTIRGMELSPSEIAAKLGIVSLPRLAFEINHDRSVTKNEAVTRAKDTSGRVEGSASFKAFMQEYRPLLPTPTPSPSATSPSSQVTQTYNPKLSELLTQYTTPSLRPATTTQDPQNEGYNMYLPILHEDTSRRSAWADSLDIRTIAYSLLSLSHSHTVPAPTRKSPERVLRVMMGYTHEFSRRGGRIAPTHHTMHTTMHALVEEVVGSILPTLRALQTYIIPTSEPLKFWTLFSLLHIYTNETPTPTPSALLSFLSTGSSSSQDGRVSWEDIHLSSRLLGTLYSLHLLRDVLRIVDIQALCGADADPEGGEALTELKNLLSSLPRGSELYSDKRERALSQVFSKDHERVLRRVLEVIRPVGEDEPEPEQPAENNDGWVDSSTAGKKGRKRKGKGNDEGGGGKVKKGSSNKKGNGNMFDVLSRMN
ncbi:hypothetical protein FQN54_002464 [Arachnomyces sp. PD_36]|nr:hypothetical protein FQN54_002464 [Arachnomyces sp. PD_36]